MKDIKIIRLSMVQSSLIFNKGHKRGKGEGVLCTDNWEIKW